MGNLQKNALNYALLIVVKFLISFLSFVDETWEKVRKQLCDQYSAKGPEKIPILIGDGLDSAQESLKMSKWGAATVLQPGVEGCESLKNTICTSSASTCKLLVTK